MEPHSLFLTRDQALKAICLDFRGYDPQPMLFCEVLRTICQDQFNYSREPGKEGVWVSEENHHRMRWLEGAELVEFMCAAVTGALLVPDQLTALCRLVFQAPCRAGRCPDTGRSGVWVQTGMETFACRQCGQCCTQLKYHDGVTADDIQRLVDLQRDDVLKWVGRTGTGSGETVYRIWVIPGTNRYAPICPFLCNGPSSGQRLCAIHDVKPQVCRHYPVSRKHAMMTGCPGFDR